MWAEEKDILDFGGYSIYYHNSCSTWRWTWGRTVAEVSEQPTTANTANAVTDIECIYKYLYLLYIYLYRYDQDKFYQQKHFNTFLGSNPSATAEVGTVDGQQVTLYRDCPAANDTHYSVQLNSTTYEFRKLCNMQAVNINSITAYVNQPTTTLNDCINLCAAWNENNVTKSTQDQICSSVCWRNGFINDDHPGQCFGYMANNASSPGGFNLQADATCDSGIWINQG